MSACNPEHTECLTRGLLERLYGQHDRAMVAAYRNAKVRLLTPSMRQFYGDPANDPEVQYHVDAADAIAEYLEDNA